MTGQPQSFKFVIKNAVSHFQTNPDCEPLCQHMETASGGLVAAVRQWVDPNDKAVCERVALILDAVADELERGPS